MALVLPESERMTFRAFRDTDQDSLYELNSNSEVMRYILGPRSYQETQDDLKKYLDYYQRHPGYGYWAAEDKITQKFMGWFVLKILNETSECEIGYRLLPEYWGLGYATEGAKAWIRYGFDQLKVTKIVAVTLPGNLGSQRVLEKSGLSFTREGTFYDCHCKYYTLNQINE